jgi:glutathione synthase/RimK-type ligase-like ATP-grasp enzyme
MDSNGLKLAVSYWLEGGNPVKQEARQRLEDSSFLELEWLHPESEHPQLRRDGVDLYHMGKQRSGSMEDLRGFQGNEVRVINSPEAVEAANDRLQCSEILESTGIPVPRWDYGSAESVEVSMPVIVKGRYEDCGSGHDHQIVEDELFYEGERLVQSFHEGETVKGYRIPHQRDRPQVFAEYMGQHRKKGGEEVLPSPRIEELVEGVYDAMDLELFEVDVVISEDEYFVVDVNPFVSLRGVADGSKLYSDAVYDRGEEDFEGYQIGKKALGNKI